MQTRKQSATVCQLQLLTTTTLHFLRVNALMSNLAKQKRRKFAIRFMLERYQNLKPTADTNRKIIKPLEKYIETERLILRELLPTDVDGMFELDSDAEVHRYIGNKPVTDKQQMVNVIKIIRRQYTDNGIGRWAIIDKKTDEFIGWSGLKFMTEITNNHKNYYDLGYRLRRKFWGQGLATETAFAFLEYAFEKLNTKEVYAMANIENDGSNNVLKKVGFKFIEKFDFDGIKHNWYKIERP